MLHWRGVLLFTILAASPVQALAESHYRDHTPDTARGQPVNPMTTNLALLQAAEKGWVDEIEKLLANGANVAARNRFGSTPLLLAAGNGRRKAVKALLAAGSDIDHRNVGAARRSFAPPRAAMCA